MKSYTYIIGWRNLDVWYYGYRTRKPSNDLWIKYFTSSKYVDDFRKEFGEPDVIRVHKIFDSKDEAIAHEQKFLKRVNAVRSDRWLNRNIAGAEFRSPDKFSDASRKKMSESAKGRVPWNKGLKGLQKPSVETIEKRRQKLIGQKRSIEQRQRISESLKGKLLSEEHKTKLKQSSQKGKVGPNKGRKFSEEHRRKLSESHKGQVAWNKSLSNK